MHWLLTNYQWLIAVVVMPILLLLLKQWVDSRKKAPTSAPAPQTARDHQQDIAALNAQGAKVTNSPVASGSNISQNINSPTLNLSLPAPISGTPARERYEEWRETIDEVHKAIEQMGYAFVPVVATKAGDERCDYQAGIRRGNRVLHNRILIAESLERSGLIKDWNELVQYAHAGRGPRDRWEQGSPTMGGFDTKARKFQEKLMHVAREDVLAPTVAPHLSGQEVPCCEFWLEFDANDLLDDRSLRIQNTGNEAVFDVVVKIPADGSGFKSDVINRLDNDKSWVLCASNGNPEYYRSLRAALAETVLHHSGESDIQTIPVLISCRTRMKQSCEYRLEIRLPLRGGIQFAIPASHSMQEVLIRSQKDRQASVEMRTTDEDQSSWPDVILECQWPSLVHESRIPGSHIVRKRPWMLRHGGPGAVYNVHVHDIDLGEYKASFPFPIRTLTDTAAVHPIICLKSEGKSDEAVVITTHDLESLIYNPPSGCDIGQYAVEIDGTEDEEIRLGDFVLEVEIPVTVSYDDKNGNQFKIKYLLHYDVYTEKGEMIRIGGIEKVAPK